MLWEDKRQVDNIHMLIKVPQLQVLGGIVDHGDDERKFGGIRSRKEFYSFPICEKLSAKRKL